MSSKMRIISILLAILVAASVFAGGGRSADPQGRVVLDVLNYTDLTVANAATVQRQIWTTFQMDNPDVVLYREDLFNEPFHNKIEAYVAAGSIPDVMYVWPSGRSTSLHSQGLLRDLAPFLQRDGLVGSFIPLAMDPSGISGGRQTMIPRSITSSHAFYTNLEVLNAVGLQPATTYSELVAQVPILRAAGYETVIIPAQSNWVMQSCLFSMVAGRFCGENWEEGFLAGSRRFTDPDFVAALDFMRRLFADGVITQANLGLDYGAGPGLFATNRSAYYIDGDWRVGAFMTDAETGQALISPARQQNIKIGVFPDIDLPGVVLNSSTSSILGVGWAMSNQIPPGSAREEAAWRLIRYLSSAEVIALEVANGGIATPTRTDINFGAMQLEPIQVEMGRMGSTYNAATCVIDGAFHSDVYNPINDGLFEIAMGTRTPQQVAQSIQQIFNQGRAAGRF